MMHLLHRLEGNNTEWISRSTKHETLYQLSANLRSRQSEQVPPDSAGIRDYFVFGFVRNPWERILSLYRYMTERRPRPEIDSVVSFSDFVQQAAEGVPWIRGLHSMRTQLDYFRTGDSRGVHADFVGHFEYLHQDFASVAKRIGATLGPLPHLNSSTNSTLNYQREYRDSSIETIGTLFHEDIEVFGYEFERREPVGRFSGHLDKSMPGIPVQDT